MLVGCVETVQTETELVGLPFSISNDTGIAATEAVLCEGTRKYLQ